MKSTGLTFAPASERNRKPILQVLQTRMPDQGTLLEIGAGTGQHAVYLAGQFPRIHWLPTDQQEELTGLQARIDLEGSSNLLPARELDVLKGPWPSGPFVAAYTANTTHIMPWEGVCGMMAGVARCLEPRSPFFIYGPFKVGGKFTTQSNELFDQQLRTRAVHMGLRDIAELESRAEHHQMLLEEQLAMPANNFLLVFRMR